MKSNKKKNEKNNKILIIVAVALVLVALIVVLVVVFNKRDNKVTTENTATIKALEGYNKKCYREENSLANYKQTNIENLKLSNEQLLFSRSSIKLEFATDEEYQEAKQKNTYGQDVVFDDVHKTIEYLPGEEVDFTKGENGDNIYLSYAEFRQSLEEAGYTCD